MKRFWTVVLLVGMAAGVGVTAGVGRDRQTTGSQAGAGAQPSAAARLEAAIKKEVVDGDLKTAIDLYRKLAQGGDRAVAAKALLRMGQCYEKQGDADVKEARKAYEQVVTEFGDQAAAAAEARTKLAALAGTAGAAGGSTMTTRRVWTGPGVDNDGHVSPDGRFLSFTDWWAGSNLAIHDLATGQNRHVTRTSSTEEVSESVVSPDSTQIAYNWLNTEGFEELRIVGVDGGNPRVVYSDKAHISRISPIAWSPDGTYVLVSLRRTDDTQELTLVRTADGSTRLVREGSVGQAVFAPDGRYIAYGLKGNISLFDMQTYRESVLSEEPSIRNVLGWSPDGRHILFSSDRSGSVDAWLIATAGGRAQGEPTFVKKDIGGTPLGLTRSGAFYYAVANQVQDVQIAELDPASGAVVSAPRAASPRWIGATRAPDWSPNGRLLAYLLSRGSKTGVVIRSTETGQERELPVGDGRFGGLVLRWLPDGKGIVVAGSEQGKPALLRIDAESGQVTPLMPIPAAISGFPRFDVSPDGRTIFYFVPDPLDVIRFRLVARDLKSGNETVISERKGIFSVGVAPDGRQLVVSTQEEKFQVVFVMPATGGEARELVRIDAAEANYRVPPSWTPDGRYVVFPRGQNGSGTRRVQIWRIAAEGGVPQRLGLTVDELWWLRVHPDGRRVAIGAWKNNIEIWALENFLPKAAAAPAVKAK